MKNLKVILLLMVLLIFNGCGNQLKNSTNVSIKPKNTEGTSISTTPTAFVSTSSGKPTGSNIKSSMSDQVYQMLPEGPINASVLKRTYIYQSTADENREKVLEKKYRNAIEKNWDKILKNSSDAGKTLFEELYHKDVAFRDNYSSVFQSPTLFPIPGKEMKEEDLGMTLEEYIELCDLYNSAKEKITEAFNTSLLIKKTGSSLIEITSDNKPKLLKTIKIDFSKKVLSIGSNKFEEVGDEKSTGYPVVVPFLRISNYEGSKFENKFLWYRDVNRKDKFDVFAISKVGDTDQIVLRVAILELNKNKVTEEMILIKDIRAE